MKIEVVISHFIQAAGRLEQATHGQAGFQEASHAQRYLVGGAIYPLPSSYSDYGAALATERSHTGLEQMQSSLFLQGVLGSALKIPTVYRTTVIA